MSDGGKKSATLEIGDEEIVVRNRYEVASITNDVMMALEFVVGSILFFYETTATIGNWFFLVGSIQFLIRPAIRLARKIHIQRINGSGVDSSGDY